MSERKYNDGTLLVDKSSQVLRKSEHTLRQTLFRQPAQHLFIAIAPQALVTEQAEQERIRRVGEQQQFQQDGRFQQIKVSSFFNIFITTP